MKKFILLLAFLNIYMAAFNQIIKGTILDKETNSPITYATIYIGGTSIATFTDGKGNFVLDIKNNNSMPLTISALGYYSLNINEFLSEQPLKVHMIPKIFELQEVSITSKGHPRIRKRNLEIFRKEFLGRTKNAKNCEIANEDDIKFINSTNNDTLRAYSINPLIINNKSLGYKITYFMDKFEYVKSQSINQLIGDFLFNDDTTSTLDDQMIQLRRNYTYFGSKMHLFRSLWQKDLKSEGFFVKNGDREVTEQELIRYQINLDPNKSNKYLYNSNRLPVFLTITYEPAQTESIMQILHNNIYFTREGYYKGHNIIWEGEMALHGIADLLPYNFKPTCDVGKLYIRKINVPVYHGKTM